MSSANYSVNKTKSNQIDSNQLLLEVQLNLIYGIESIYSFIKHYVKRFFQLILNYIYQIYLSSALYTLVFSIKTYFLNNKSRRARLMEWVRKQLHPMFRPNNFNVDWCDGIRLCALCESIVPGCCPRYDLLNPSNQMNNLKLALCLIKNNLKIKPDITEKEIFGCQNEAKLVHLLSQMKIIHTKLLLKSPRTLLKTNRTESHNETPRKLSSGYEKKYFESFEKFFEKCYVKGMGTTLGVRSRRAKFSIYFGENYPQFSFIIEIVGPNDSFCSEKIEIDPRILTGSFSDQTAQDLIMRAAAKIMNDKSGMKIPLFYEQDGDHITITYIPLLAGEHQISIIWQGKHIIGSPYFASIEETEYLKQELNEIKPNFVPGLQYPLCLLNTESQEFGLEDIGTVIRKKIYKKSIMVNNKEMDYETYVENQRLKQKDIKLNETIETKTCEKMADGHDIPESISNDSQIAETDNLSEIESLEGTMENSTKESNENLEDDTVTNQSQLDDVVVQPKKHRTLPFRTKSSESTLRKIRPHKTLKKVWSENNENFTKEFSEMAKNLKDKFKRNKKT